MKKTFLNQPFPVITGIFAGQTPQELIANARNAEADGARGLAIDLVDLKPEFRNRDALQSVIDAVNLPCMFVFYRNDMQQQLDDPARQTVLLEAAAAGAAMIDVMGDLYDPSPLEITRDAVAVERQKKLIDQIHAAGAQVVISSHMPNCARTAEETLEHLQETAARGADVVKIVTAADTADQLAEAVRTTLLLKREMKIPFIHLCNGKFSRPHRYLCQALGVAIVFGVHDYDPRYSFHQPTIRSLQTVLQNLHWNINDLV